MELFGTMKINSKNHLEIGGCDAVKLAKKYGTPLYVMDEYQIRKTLREYYDNFTRKHGAKVIYASKAFSNIAMFNIVADEGIGLDVVSGGELYTALNAGVPASNIYFNGNNKSSEELIMALKAGIGRIIVDNFHEIELLKYITDTLDLDCEVLIRITPGIDAHTHEYIMTGQIDSKFGFNVIDGQAEAAIKQILKMNHVRLKGIHCHIGSQIFEMESYEKEVEVVMSFIKIIYDKLGYMAEELDLGGGFGVYYSDGDNPDTIENYSKVIFRTLDKMSKRLGINIPSIIVEPGRSIVANAGITLYTVGSIKNIPGIRKYVSVDGGMTDNPRLALYGAKHEVCLANRMADDLTETVSISGKCCESGDMLAWDVSIPHAVSGDILAIMGTGAYNYSMASNYNRLPKPAVVLVFDGRSDIIVKRETYEDIVRNDVLPARLNKSRISENNAI